jgi:hypothetical protein
MDERAFAASSWRPEDVMHLFEAHPDYLVPENDNETVKSNYGRHAPSALEYWDNQKHREKWDVDYSSMYLIHAFGHVKGIKNFTEISPSYILARQNNCAKAVYPA